MYIMKIPLAAFFFLLAFSLTLLTHSFIPLVSSCFFIFMRGEVHCGRFGGGESVMEVRQQMMTVAMVSVIVNEGTSWFLFYVLYA